ncbi:hypothetical protein WY13_01898 [Clostridium ljungdahlii]|uniref:Uncharacterized protein n=2 Tax=Clostridium ljungdahlii TaxID=1538 RepID=A0A168PIC0_9CLOT|nr:hypothetical protein [Clostridium ljungdahlii]OAA87783.1 hypothetical protein WY13_01898 [Clostridium ljungdahlii]
MGYSSLGNEISNPYFPPDHTSNATPGDYGYDLSPWTYSLACPSGDTKWDNPDDDAYYPVKLDALRKLIQQEPTMNATCAETWAKYLSLRSDPTMTTAVFVGSIGGGTYYGDLVLRESDNDIRNLRIVYEVVKDKETGAILGTFTRNAHNPDNYIPSVATNKKKFLIYLRA